MQLSLLSLALLAPLSSAQDWGTVGSWELVQALPPAPGGRPNGAPPTSAYRHATYVPGFFVLPGNFSSGPGSSDIDIWLFNIANGTWVK